MYSKIPQIPLRDFAPLMKDAFHSYVKQAKGIFAIFRGMQISCSIVRRVRSTNCSLSRLIIVFARNCHVIRVSSG